MQAGFRRRFGSLLDIFYTFNLRLFVQRGVLTLQIFNSVVMKKTNQRLSCLRLPCQGN